MSKLSDCLKPSKLSANSRGRLLAAHQRAVFAGDNADSAAVSIVTAAIRQEEGAVEELRTKLNGLGAVVPLKLEAPAVVPETVPEADAFMSRLRSNMERLKSQPKLTAENQQRYQQEIAPLEERAGALRESVAKAKQKFQSTKAEAELTDIAGQMNAVYERLLAEQSVSPPAPLPTGGEPPEGEVPVAIADPARDRLRKSTDMLAAALRGKDKAAVASASEEFTGALDAFDRTHKLDIEARDEDRIRAGEVFTEMREQAKPAPAFPPPTAAQKAEAKTRKWSVKQGRQDVKEPGYTFKATLPDGRETTGWARTQAEAEKMARSFAETGKAPPDMPEEQAGAPLVQPKPPAKPEGYRKELKPRRVVSAEDKTQAEGLRAEAKKLKDFDVGEKVIWHTATDEDVIVNWRGPAPDNQSVVLSPSGNQITVPNARLRRQEAPAMAKADVALTDKEKAAGERAPQGKLNTYDETVAENMRHMGTALSDWRAVPVKRMVESTDDKGRKVRMPEFDFPAGYESAPSLYKASAWQAVCELCAHPIKNAFWIQNDQKKWTMLVGSECITRFEDQSGEQMASAVAHKQNRAFLGEVLAALKEMQDNFRRYSEGRERWAHESVGGAYGRLLDVRGKMAADSNDGAVSRWVSTKGDEARKLLSEYTELKAQPGVRQAAVMHMENTLRNIEGDLRSGRWKGGTLPPWQRTTLEQQATKLRERIAGWKAPAVEGGERPAEEKQPWEMTRAEFDRARNGQVVEVIRDHIRRGGEVVCRTQMRQTRIADPEHIRLTQSGGVQTRERTTWVNLVESQIDSIASQAGIVVPDPDTKVYHQTEVERALAAGQPVPAAVLADYPELKEQPRPARIVEAITETNTDVEANYQKALTDLKATTAEGWWKDTDIDEVATAGTLAGKTPQDIYDALTGMGMDTTDATEKVHAAFLAWPEDQNTPRLDVDISGQVRPGSVVEEHYYPEFVTPPRRFQVEEVVERADGGYDLRGYFWDTPGAPAVLDSGKGEFVLSGWHIAKPKAEATLPLPGMEEVARARDEARGLPPMETAAGVEKSAVQTAPKAEAPTVARPDLSDEEIARRHVEYMATSQTAFVEKWESGEAVGGNDLVNFLRTQGVDVPADMKGRLQHDDTLVSKTSAQGAGMKRAEAKKVHFFASKAMIDIGIARRTPAGVDPEIYRSLVRTGAARKGDVDIKIQQPREGDIRVEMVKNGRLTWTSGDGRTLTAWITPEGAWMAAVDGEETGGCYGPDERSITSDLRALGVVARVGRVCLRQPQLDALRAEAEQVAAAYRLSPEGLRAERRGLLDRIAGEVAAVRAARERQMADECGCARPLPGYDAPAIRAAEAALAEFDRAHPEIRRTQGVEATGREMPTKMTDTTGSAMESGEPTLSGQPIPAEADPRTFRAPDEVPTGEALIELESKIKALEAEYAEVKPKKQEEWKSLHLYGPNGLEKMRERRHLGWLAELILNPTQSYARRVAALDQYEEKHDRRGGAKGAWEFVQAELAAWLRANRPQIPESDVASVAIDAASSMFSFPLSKYSTVEEAGGTAASVWRNKQQRTEMDAKKETEQKEKELTEQEAHAAAQAKIEADETDTAAQYVAEVPQITVEDMRLLENMPVLPTGFATPEQWEEGMHGTPRWVLVSAGLMTEDGKLNAQGRRLFRAAKYRDGYLPFGLHEVNEHASIPIVGPSRYGEGSEQNEVAYLTGTVRGKKFWSDTRSMWPGLPPKHPTISSYPIGKTKSGGSRMEDAALSLDQLREAVPVRPVAMKNGMTGREVEGIILEAADGQRVAIDSRYYDYGVTQNPGAQWMTPPDNIGTRPVALVREHKGEREMVGMVMPIRYAREGDKGSEEIDAAKAITNVKAESGEFDAGARAALRVKYPKGPKTKVTLSMEGKPTVDGIEEVPGLVIARGAKGEGLGLYRKASGSRVMYGSETNLRVAARFLASLPIDWTLESGDKLTAQIEAAKTAAMTEPIGGARTDVDFSDIRIRPSEDAEVRAAWEKFDADNPGLIDMALGRRIFPAGYTENVLKMKPEQLGSKNTVFTKDKIEQVRRERKKRGKTLGSVLGGIDPLLLKQAFMEGGYWFEAGLREVGSWLATMRQKYGASLTDEHLRQVWRDLSPFRRRLNLADRQIAAAGVRGAARATEAGRRDIMAVGKAAQATIDRQAEQAEAARRQDIEQLGRAGVRTIEATRRTGRQDLVAVGAAAARTIEATRTAGERAVERTAEQAEAERVRDVGIIGRAAVRQMESQERKAERKATAEVKGVAKFVARQTQLLKRASDQEIADFARERLGKADADVVVRLLPKIVANKGTLENRQKLIDWINEKADARRKQRAVASVKKALKGLRRGLTPEVRAAVGDLAETFSLTSHNAGTLAAAQALLDAAEAQAIRSPIMDILPSRVERARRLLADAQRPLLRDLSTEEIDELASTLRHLAGVNSELLASRMAVLAGQADADKAMARRELAGVHKVEKYAIPVGVRGELPTQGVVRKFLGLIARLRLKQHLQWVFGTDSNTLTMVNEGLTEAQERAKGMLDEAVGAVEDELNAQKWGSAERRHASEALDSRSKRGKQWTPFRASLTETQRVELPAATASDRVDAEPKRLPVLELTRGERIFMLGMFMDPRVQGYILQGAGVRFEQGRRMAGVVYLTADDMRAIWDSASPAEHAIAERMMGVYAGFAPQIEAAWTERQGYSPQFSRQNWPIHRATEEFERDPNESLKQWRNDNLLPKDAGTLKERTGGIASILVEDAFAGFAHHSALIASFVAKETAMERTIRLLDDQALREDVSKRMKYGLSLLGAIKETVKRFSGYGKADKYAAESALSMLIRGIHVSSLAFKPHVILGQAVSANKLQLTFGTKYLSLGVARAVGNGGSRARTLIGRGYSPMLLSRVRGEGFDLLTAGTRSRAVAGVYGDKGGLLSWLGAELIQGSDNTVTYAAVEAALAEGQDRGLAGEELDRYAVRRAAQAVRDTQATADVLTITPLMQESRERIWMKLIPGMIFNTERAKTFNLLAEEAMRYRDSAHTAADKARLTRALIVVGFDSALYRGVKWGTRSAILAVAGWIAYLLTGRRPPDEEEQHRRLMAQFRRGLVQDVVGLYPVVGDVAGDMAEQILRGMGGGKQGGFRTTENPVSAALADVGEGLYGTFRALSEDDPELRSARLWRNAGKIGMGAGALAGLPLPAVREFVRPGLQAVGSAKPRGQFNHVAQAARKAATEERVRLDAPLLAENPHHTPEELKEWREEHPIAENLERERRRTSVVEEVLRRLHQLELRYPERVGEFQGYADGAALVGAGLPLTGGARSPFGADVPQEVASAVDREIGGLVEQAAHPAPGPAVRNRAARIAEWRREVGLAVEILEALGVDQVRAAAVLRGRIKDRDTLASRLTYLRARWPKPAAAAGG